MLQVANGPNPKDIRTVSDGARPMKRDGHGRRQQTLRSSSRQFTCGNRDGDGDARQVEIHHRCYAGGALKRGPTASFAQRV